MGNNTTDFQEVVKQRYRLIRQQSPRHSTTRGAQRGKIDENRRDMFTSDTLTGDEQTNTHRGKTEGGTNDRHKQTDEMWKIETKGVQRNERRGKERCVLKELRQQVTELRKEAFFLC